MHQDKQFTLVIGLGKTGLSIARYLRSKQMPFVVFDTREQPTELAAFQAEFSDVEVYLQHFPQSLMVQVLEIICSPGVSLETPLLLDARTRSIPIYGDIECLARAVCVPIIAITGTNGKSTVTTLVGEMAKAAGKRVAVAGNIGTPVLDLLSLGEEYDLWVLEISSFQLDLTDSLRPTTATILNITPDHLDRHHHIEAYIASKQRIYQQATYLLYNRDDALTLPKLAEPYAVNMTTNEHDGFINFGLTHPESGQWGIHTVDSCSYLAYGDIRLMLVDELKIKGRHNWTNALAACALANTVGVDFQSMTMALKNFTGLPHRVQWVRTLNDVDWINDSKGTNVGATCSAISGIGGAMQGKIILIAGGLGKGADFSELCVPVAEHVRMLVLIGQDADKIEQALIGVVPMMRTATLEDAVQLAHQQAQPGDVVMLSPACASQDMFQDFNDRGRVFMSAVEAL